MVRSDFYLTRGDVSQRSDIGTMGREREGRAGRTVLPSVESRQKQTWGGGDEEQTNRQ